MIKKMSAFLLLLTILVSVAPAGVNAQATAEAKCFDLLAEHAQNNPKFSDLDLSQVQKINGKDPGITSKKFSVETYSDFLNTFNTELPERASDIFYYPNDMDQVPSDYRYKRHIHKSNRNNAATIINIDNTETPIKHWEPKNGSDVLSDLKKFWSGKKSEKEMDKDHYRQKIKGHYIDSKYVTFGRQSELAFSFPSRDPGAGKNFRYPTGRPVKDMREYVMYTHNLSSKNGGNFMSCNLLRVIPQGEYTLQTHGGQGESISWDNFGGTKMKQSNAISKVVDSNFRLNEIEYTISDRKQKNGNLLRFYVLNLAYNNKSDFMNPFVTSGEFVKAMRNAKNVAQLFIDMRSAYYSRVEKTGLKIAQ